MTTDSAPVLKRPVPVSDPVSAAYWAGARDHRLVISRCESCSRYVHPPQPVCPGCLHEALTFEVVSGRGQVYAFSIMHLPGVPGLEPPFGVVVVELDEQPGLLTVGNLLGCPLNDIRVGMRVKVTFEELEHDVTLPQWQPEAP